MLCASIWKEYRVGSLHPASAISSFARVEVCPVVVVVHSVLVVIRMRLLLVVRGRWVISRLVDERRRWRRCMVEAGSNVTMSTMKATMVGLGKKHRGKKDKKLHSRTGLTDDCVSPC